MPLGLLCEKMTEGLKISITDVIDVPGKHYAIAVDIYDHKTDVVLDAVLLTMNRNDTVTLLTFGYHTEIYNFDMTKNFQDIVRTAMSRRETGCNVALALHAMDKIECDQRVLISNGGFDDGQPNVSLEHRVLLVSPGQCTYPAIEMPWMPELPSTETVTDAHLTLMAGDRVCYRKQIRQLLDKPRPQYHCLKIDAGQTIFVSPLAYGGITTIYVGHFEGRVKLSYFNDDGGTFYTEIETHEAQQTRVL